MALEKGKYESEYKRGVLKHIESSIAGDVVKIDNPLGASAASAFNLLQSRYITIMGTTGSGKTSYGDWMIALEPYFWLCNNPSLGVHFEVLYFSLERKKEFKHAKWLSWMHYRHTGEKIPADTIMGWGKEPITQEKYQELRTYDAHMEGLLSHVKIYDGKQTTEKIKQLVDNRALELGILYQASDIGVHVQNSPVPTKFFDTDSETIDTPRGEEQVIQMTHTYPDGSTEDFLLGPYEHKYFLHNPKTFVFIVIDGIGLVGGTSFAEKKSTIDETSSILATARDMYGFSPVVVVQVNRAIGDVSRQKMQGSDLSPQLEDIQGSSQIAHDSDLVLALHDVHRYKAYDKEGFHKGYNITNGLMSPKGFCRFRGLHVLKNSFGMDGIKFGCIFVGEVNHFILLPKPDESGELAYYYNKIATNDI